MYCIIGDAFNVRVHTYFLRIKLFAATLGAQAAYSRQWVAACSMQQVLWQLQQSASPHCARRLPTAYSTLLSALIFCIFLFRLHIFIFASHAAPRPNAQFLRLLCRHGSWQLAVGSWQVPVCPAACSYDSQPRAASFLTPVPSQRMGVCVKTFRAFCGRKYALRQLPL